MPGTKKDGDKQYNPNWGGAREGGGRPKKNRTYVGIRLDNDLYEWVISQGDNKTEVINDALRDYLGIKKADK
jgi:uncharacterized protein (DUF4415 family)